MRATCTLPALWANAPRKGPFSGCPLGPKPRAAVLPAYVVTPEFAFYRKYTEGLLRRYMHVSMEMGRVPSLLGNYVFRGRASSYRMTSFEDAVILVYDVEKCLKRIDPLAQQLIARVALQEYTQAEAAELTGMSVRSVIRKYGEALDRLTAIFLELKLLTIPALQACQEGGASWKQRTN